MVDGEEEVVGGERALVAVACFVGVCGLASTRRAVKVTDMPSAGIHARQARRDRSKAGLGKARQQEGEES